MRKWIIPLIVLGLLLPPAYVLADRVRGAFQSIDATDNVTTAKVVTDNLTVTGTPTFVDNTVNGADLIDNTVNGAKTIDNTIDGSKAIDNTIALGKINHTGTASAGTFLRGDGSWAAILPQIAAYRNLAITTPADNQSVTITADKIVAVDNADVPRILSSVSLTVDLDVAGANGLDNGTLAANTGYFLYVIDNGATTVGLASTSATSPAMPSGYTYKALVGWCTTDNTATPFNVLGFTQVDDVVSFDVKAVVATIASTTTTVVNLAAGGALTYAVCPPSIAKVARMKTYALGGNNYFANPTTFADSQSARSTTVEFEAGPTGSLSYRFDIPLHSSQTFYHQANGSPGHEVSIVGFTLKR